MNYIIFVYNCADVMSKMIDFLLKLNSDNKLFYILITSILTISGSVIITNRNFKLQKRKELIITIADIISTAGKVLNFYRLQSINIALHSLYHNLSSLYNNHNLYRERSENFLYKSNELLELFDNQRAELNRLIIIYGVNSKKKDDKILLQKMIENINLLVSMDFSGYYNISDFDEVDKKRDSLHNDVQTLVFEKEGVKALYEIRLHFKKKLENNNY